jgi:hypothetical protein
VLRKCCLRSLGEEGLEPSPPAHRRADALPIELSAPRGRLMWFCRDERKTSLKRVSESTSRNNAPGIAGTRECRTCPYVIGAPPAGILGAISTADNRAIAKRSIGARLWSMRSRAGHFRPVNSLTWCDDVLPSRRAPRFRLRFRRIAQRESVGFNTAPEVEGSSPSPTASLACPGNQAMRSKRAAQ